MKQLSKKINGVKWSYTTFGEGKPLLILHGWGSSAKVMTPLAQQLQTQHQYFIVDFPGFGNSDKPNDTWDVGDYAEQLKSFIELVIKEKTDIIAHSFGGRVMLKILSQDWSSQWIGKVLITGGAGMKPRRSWKFYYKKYLAKSLKAPFLILPQPLQEKGLNWVRSTDLWKSLGSSDYKQLDGVMRQVFVKTVSEYLEPCLPRIEHEVFLLWGKNDDATPWYQAERIDSGLRNSALVGIDNAGHYAFLDQPTQFVVIAKAYFEPQA